MLNGQLVGSYSLCYIQFKQIRVDNLQAIVILSQETIKGLPNYQTKKKIEKAAKDGEKQDILLAAKISVWESKLIALLRLAWIDHKLE